MASSKDDDVTKLYQLVRDLEKKVDKLEKLNQKIIAIEAYINALDAQFKGASEAIQRLLGIFK